MTHLIDPRLGDIEDDASSTKRRSLLSIAGSMLAEISLPKLISAWLLLIVLPCLLLGLAPLIGSAWISSFSHSLADSYRGVWPFLLLLIVVVLGFFGGRPFLRAAEQGFWSLNSIAVQPSYALCREALRHVFEMLFARRLDENGRARLRAACAAIAGVVMCGIALLVMAWVWPYTRWDGEWRDLVAPGRMLVPTLANGAVILCGYCAAASLVWGIADATMDQPLDFRGFADPAQVAPRWRIAHLSDIHIVAPDYGFRLESGRLGPRGNDRLARLLDGLEAIHAARPLDHIIITGDITDAGLSAEWAEFFAALSRHPRLAERTLLLPGNHDINVVDRSNPARLDLPTSPGPRLREMRSLSGMAAVQGGRVQVVDLSKRRLGDTLAAALAPHRDDIARFADTGTVWLSRRLERVWADAFPMVLPPDGEDGLGVILLNSTARTHFSFTNALGLISAEQALAIEMVVRQFPSAFWVMALHHHMIEYPMRAKAFSERIGTALINGSWFVRQLQRFGDRIVVMHGHRHIDWIGHCGGLRIISAPSPVMERTGEGPSYILIHTLGVDASGSLALLPPERLEIPGAPLLA
jgi:hypothetical protein